MICIVIACCNAPARGQDVIVERAQATQIARSQGLVTRLVTPTGGSELVAFVNGLPWYYSTFNADAADTISTDECLPGGSSGLGLTGSGVTMGIWDFGGVQLSHQEFGGRVSQIDSAGVVFTHATHVAGTMTASGVVSAAMGMSPSAWLNAYDWNNDIAEMRAAAAAGMRVSNHSYGITTGWWYGNGTEGLQWYWYGDVSVSVTEDNDFGRYSGFTMQWDQVAHDYPYYLICRAAGNDRDDFGPGPGGEHVVYFGFQWNTSTDTRDPDGDYDCITTVNVAKNILTVGAVADVIGGYAAPGGVAMSTFSGWGPTDDGRIKPDIVANGIGLYSSSTGLDNAYHTDSGTSMASPNASGSVGLLIEHWRTTHPGEGDMRSATVKGLLLHTADETGAAAGPDYQFGWGLMNTLAAADTISQDTAQPLTITEWDLINGNQLELAMVTDGTSGELRATICWTDPPGTSPGNVLNSPIKMLVNDLDLRIEQTSTATTHQPWVLDPANPALPATRGDNNTDNVEQVVIASPGTDIFTLRVTHKATLSGGAQNFSLIITGASAIRACSVAGTITLDQSQYFCDGTVLIEVVDCDLDLNGGAIDTVDVTLSSAAEPAPGETVTLTETAVDSAVFTGTIPLDTIDAAGVLQIAAGDTVTAAYTDADDGSGGGPVQVTDTATVGGGASMARIWVNLEIDALDPGPVTRDVEFVVTECTGPSSQTRTIPVTFTGGQATGVLLDNLVATPLPEWISTREGHTLTRLTPLTFDACNEAIVDLTGAQRLISGDFQTTLVAQDGLVDVVDYSIMSSGWLQLIDAGLSTGADATGNGVVDTADFTALQVNTLLMSDAVDGCGVSYSSGPGLDPGPVAGVPPNVSHGQGMPRVDLILGPQPRVVTRGATFDVGLYAVSTDATGVVPQRRLRRGSRSAPSKTRMVDPSDRRRRPAIDGPSAVTTGRSIAALDVALRWDPTVVELVGAIDNGPYAWMMSGFPDDAALDGLNDSMLDGDAKYTALARIGSAATATPEGLLVTTLRFVARADNAATAIVMAPTLGGSAVTRVFGGDAPNRIVTGSLFNADVTVAPPRECDGDGDV
ncbi:MAG: S8 family serine peptidase, partial [Phycisphaerae bacterium]